MLPWTVHGADKSAYYKLILSKNMASHGMKPFAPWIYKLSIPMARFCHTERSRELKTDIFTGFSFQYNDILGPSSLGLRYWESFFYLWAVFGRYSSCFHFSFLVATPEDHREHTGNWQLFLMRGVCEAASHSEFPALLFSGIRGFGMCLWSCLHWQRIP